MTPRAFLLGAEGETADPGPVEFTLNCASGRYAGKSHDFIASWVAEDGVLGPSGALLGTQLVLQSQTGTKLFTMLAGLLSGALYEYAQDPPPNYSLSQYRAALLAELFEIVMAGVVELDQQRKERSEG